MIRKEALKILKECCDKGFNRTTYTYDEYVTARDMAIKALEQEPCEDAIGRQAVYEQINCWIGSGEYRYTNATDYLTKRVANLPSIQPKPKTGHWIRQDNTKEPLYGWYFCSECNSVIGDKTKFCSNCGAKMVEPQERGYKE